jgi:hypothetical protein
MWNNFRKLRASGELYAPPTDRQTQIFVMWRLPVRRSDGEWVSKGLVDHKISEAKYVPLIYQYGRCVGHYQEWARLENREWVHCDIEPGRRTPWPSDPAGFASKYAEVWAEEYKEALVLGLWQKELEPSPPHTP